MVQQVYIQNFIYLHCLASICKKKIKIKQYVQILYILKNKVCDLYASSTCMEEKKIIIGFAKKINKNDVY